MEKKNENERELGKLQNKLIVCVYFFYFFIILISKSLPSPNTVVKKALLTSNIKYIAIG